MCSQSWAPGPALCLRREMCDCSSSQPASRTAAHPRLSSFPCSIRWSFILLISFGFDCVLFASIAFPETQFLVHVSRTRIQSVACSEQTLVSSKHV